jgi:hypothetical protein
MLCACGCGKTVESTRPGKIYFSGQCRQRAKNQRHPVERRNNFQTAFRNDLEKRCKAICDGVTPSEGEDVRQSSESLVFLTSGEVVEFLRIGNRTLQRWRQKGMGPPYLRVSPTMIRYPWVGVQYWLGASMESFGTKAEQAAKR